MKPLPKKRVVLPYQRRRAAEWSQPERVHQIIQEQLGVFRSGSLEIRVAELLAKPVGR